MTPLAPNFNWYMLTPHPALTKVASFTNLQKGWAFGEGTAFPQSVLFDAQQLIEHLVRHGHPEIDVFPGRDGQVVVTAYGARVNVDFSISADAKAPVTLSFEVDGEDEIADDPISAVSMETMYLALGGFLKWLSCESSIPSNTRAGNVDSRAQHLNLQVTAPAYRSSNLNVQSVNQVQSARTLKLVIAA